jgi:predicted AAA+ superfamily ATPase
LEIRRTLLSALKAHLEKKEITLLVGARQVGKTTLLKALQEELKREEKPFLFYNLDYAPHFELFQTQRRFVKQLELATGGEKTYVFIDEIQRVENAGLFLKGIYDLDLPYKFILSGSGSLELKEKVHESLAGRKRLFELSSVSFEEFADYKTEYRYSGKLKLYFELNPDAAQELLLEYLNFGGYPRVVTEKKLEEKLAILREIYQSYIEKDIQLLLNIEKTHSFLTMIQLLAAKIGQQLNYHQLSRDTGLSFATLKQYLWYTEKTYVLDLISPFFRNKEKEIVKAPQPYFRDLGLRNIALEVAGNIQSLKNNGLLFQNFIFSLLRQKTAVSSFRIQHWRTKSQAEVDFVLDRAISQLPIEIKSGSLRKPVVSRSMRSFIEKYQPEEAWVINLSLNQRISINDTTTVHFKPWHQLIGSPVDEVMS